MGIVSVGTLARTRRTATGTVRRPGTGPVPEAGPAAPGAGAGAPAENGLSALEKAVPSEVIAFYTAVIAACETVLARSPAAEYTPFRAAVFAVGLIATAVASGLSILPTVRGAGPAGLRRSWQRVVTSAEWGTAILSFTAWGLVIPGSFLYTWLGANVLTITVATVTAGTTLVIAVGFAPRLQRRPSGGGAGNDNDGGGGGGGGGGDDGGGES